MLIFYFSTNYSCLSSSFLYVDHFPTSVIFFQSEKVLVALLMVQICWQSILSTFIHLKMSLFFLSWDMFTGHIFLGELALPLFPLPFPKFQFFKGSIPLSSDLHHFFSIIAIFFSFFLLFYIVCHLPLGAFMIFLFIFYFQRYDYDMNISGSQINFLNLYIYIFHQLWEKFDRSCFKYFFLPYFLSCIMEF